MYVLPFHWIDVTCQSLHVCGLFKRVTRAWTLRTTDLIAVATLTLSRHFSSFAISYAININVVVAIVSCVVISYATHREHNCPTLTKKHENEQKIRQGVHRLCGSGEEGG